MKKRILLPILVVVAMLISMFGTALPVMASQVTLAIDPVPLTPNIYRIGDTITYNCSVTNPSGNTHTNNYTLVEAILPDGTHVVFTTSLIQEPGESNSWTTTYNVTLADVIADSPDYVEAALHTDGRDSANGRLLSTVYCDSTIIQPGIDIEKYVSVDGGTTWLDADTATGPLAAVGSDVKFYVAVNNTGNVELTNIVVGDTDFTFTGIASTLAAGASDTSDVVTVSAVAGQQYDLADVRGTPPVGANVTDSDPAYYFGSAPNIDIEKYVSVDGGTTWLDADNATGPSAAVPGDVKFKVTVCNNGTADLTNILVSDTDFTFTGVATSLAAGACDDSDILTVAAVAGQQYDLANVTATVAEGPNVFDEDPAYYTGLTSGIDIEKYVSVDGGVTWLDADSPPGPSAVVGNNVKFKVTVCNNGTTDLTNILVNDTDFTFTGVATSLIAGACDDSDILTVAAVAGQQYDLADVTGTPPAGPDVTDEDPAYYRTSSEVGGTALPVNKWTLLAPWAVLAGFLGVLTFVMLRKRRQA